MSAGKKRPLYLVAEENRALLELAREQGTSLNYCMRVGLRLLVGLPVPRWVRERARDNLEERE